MAANLAAAKASETIESRRSVLGMKGSVAEGLALFPPWIQPRGK